MFRFPVAPVTSGRLGWIVLGLVIGVMSSAALGARTPAVQQAPAAAKSPYVFASDAALILNFIKADKTADFEMVMAKLREALAKSDKPERKQQAAAWKIFKAAEGGPNGSVIYVSLMDPAVKGANYDVMLVLSEVFPKEVQALYETYKTVFGSPSQNFLNLSFVSGMGK